METAARRSDPAIELTVEEKLYTQPYEFDFYQAIRILSSLQPEKKSFGESEKIREEPVHIKSSVSYGVPSSDIQGLRYSTKIDHPPILTVNFLGVSGIQGPLPQPYMNLLTDRLQQKDTAFRDFLDIFNHRFVSYWYLLQKKHILGLEHISAEKTWVGEALLDLGGICYPDLLKHLHVHSRSLINYAPLFWQQQRSVMGLYKIVKGYFGCKVGIREFIGAWRIPPAKDLSYLGHRKGQFQRLGQDLILGNKSWDTTAKMAITLQDLSWKKYLKFLPDKLANKAFKDIVRFYKGFGTMFILKVRIQKEKIPPAILGKDLYLGQTSWLTRGEGKGFKKNPSAVILRDHW